MFAPISARVVRRHLQAAQEAKWAVTGKPLAWRSPEDDELKLDGYCYIPGRRCPTFSDCPWYEDCARRRIPEHIARFLDD